MGEGSVMAKGWFSTPWFVLEVKSYEDHFGKWVEQYRRARDV